MNACTSFVYIHTFFDSCTRLGGVRKGVSKGQPGDDPWYTHAHTPSITSNNHEQHSQFHAQSAPCCPANYSCLLQLPPEDDT